MVLCPLLRGLEAGRPNGDPHAAVHSPTAFAAFRTYVDAPSNFDDRHNCGLKPHALHKRCHGRNHAGLRDTQKRRGQKRRGAALRSHVLSHTTTVTTIQERRPQVDLAWQRVRVRFRDGAPRTEISSAALCFAVVLWRLRFGIPLDPPNSVP